MLCVIVGSEKSKVAIRGTKDLEHYVLLVAPFDHSSDGLYRRAGVGRLLESWIDMRKPGLRVLVPLIWRARLAIVIIPAI
ncbi:hypothetical protein QL093DRAFT_2546961 [Fusarium oxysporum]|nr:hypothetical protein QL093DRAFT_2546961 [Fusarium oxysporum]